MELYDYYRSSCCYRVRIALKLKKQSYDLIPVDLTLDEQHAPGYIQQNPQSLVPTLVTEGISLTQSLAIIEYLEERYPDPTLLPGTLYERAQIRSLAQLIACDIHPVNNLRILNTLRKQWRAPEDKVMTWYHKWLKEGFDAIEQHLANYKRTSLFCYANQPTLADICLIPQVYNAIRFKFSLEPYPLIAEINRHCLTLEAFHGF